MRFLWLQAEVAWTCIRIRKIPRHQTVADSNTRPADDRSLEFCRTSKEVTEIPREIRTPVSRQQTRRRRTNSHTATERTHAQAGSFGSVQRSAKAPHSDTSDVFDPSLQPSGRGPTFSGVYGAYHVTLEISRFGASCDSHHDVYDATSGQAATFHPHRSCRDADADATAYRRKPGERPCRRILSMS